MAGSSSGTMTLIVKIFATVLFISVVYFLRHDIYDDSQQNAIDCQIVSSAENLQCSRPANASDSTSDRNLINYWKDLSETEARDLVRWLHLPGLNLNLIDPEIASINDTYIWMFESMTPNKSDILRVMEARKQGLRAPSMTRYARVVLFEGVYSEFGMREYQVGPIPITNVTTMTPLTYIYNNRNGTTPFNARFIDDARVASYTPLLENFTNLINPIIRDLYNKNGTDFVAHPVMPSRSSESKAELWLQWALKGTGSILKPCGFWVQLQIGGRDPAKYSVKRIRYHDRSWMNFEDFRKSWQNGELMRKWEMLLDDEPWTVPSSPTGDLDLEDVAAPIMIRDRKLRYKLDPQNSHISYLGWDFFYSWRRGTGLSFWDVKFRGDSVLYEMSLQEASASYSMANDPAAMQSQLLDTHFGLGASSTPLVEGYDCPNGATFLDSSTFAGESIAKTTKNICIFEMDLGRPMSRHSTRDFVRSTKGVALIVRWIATVGNYDYLFDTIFHPDGSIELEARASGFLLARHFYGTSSLKYGSKIRNSVQGVIHDHIINFKLDFDILGIDNSFQIQRLKTTTEFPDWTDDGEPVEATYLETSYVDNEDDARLNWPSNGDAMFSIVNKDMQNRWGSTRGYRISPGVGSIFRSISKKSPLNVHNSAHAKNHISITRQKDSEPSSSSSMNQNLPLHPLVDFDKFFNSESLTQTDIVVWANIGMHHFPRAEDSPFTLLNEARAGLLISPFNFKDSDLSSDYRNTVLMTRKAHRDDVSPSQNTYDIVYKGPEIHSESPVAGGEVSVNPGYLEHL